MPRETDRAQSAAIVTGRKGRPVVDRRVALLRGINVGTAKRIAMAELRRLVEELGYTDVRTLLNSGNVVFTVPGGSSGDPAARIEKAIEARHGFASRVTLLTGRDVIAAVAENPLASVAKDPSRLLVMACPDPKALARLKALLDRRWTPEAVALGRRVAYLWCAAGLHDSPLWAAAGRALGDSGTARNMAT